MSTTCTWTRARKQSPVRDRRCPYRVPGAQTLHDVLARARDVETMTGEELRHAFAVLGRHVRGRRMDVLGARWRIAVQLERLDG